MQLNLNNQILNKIKLSLYNGLLFGVIAGSLKALHFIIVDSYSSYELQKFGIYILKYNLNTFVLWTLLGSLIFAIIWIVFDSFEGLSVSGLAVILIFIPIGYFLNKNFLPSFKEVESIIGNCVLSVIAITIFIVLYRKVTRNLKYLERLYSKIVYFALIIVIVIINFFDYFKPDYKRLASAPKKYGKEYLSFFEFSEDKKNVNNSTNGALNISNKKEFLQKFHPKVEKVREEILVMMEGNKDIHDTVISLADAILNREFTIWGITKQLDEKINWYKNPTTDDVWLRTLNELEWIKHITAAYVLTKDEKYAKDYNRIMESWFEQITMIEWKDESNPVWRLIGAGLRLSDSLINSFFIFLPSKNVNDDLKIKILSTIHDHAQFLSHFRSPRRNHLIQETYGLLKAALLFPEFKMANNWLELANKRFELVFDKDVYPDGGYSEASSFYQFYVVLLMQRILKFADFYDVSLNPIFYIKVEKMYEFLIKITRPDGRFPQINDGFNGKNLEYLFDYPAKRFGREDFEFYASNREYGKAPKETSLALPYTGLYVMRTGWDENANYCIFDGGLFGSAHGHEDMLNFEIFALGKSFIVDPGTYTYVYNSWHKYFQNSVSHNTVLVDGKGQLRHHVKSKWVTDPHSKLPNKWISTHNYDYVEATYRDGYGFNKENIDKSVYHTRRMLFVKPDYWILWDILKGKGEHKFDQLFHFMPMTVEINKNKSIITRNDNEANLLIFPLNKEELTVNKIIGSEDPIQGWYANKYGEKEPAPVIIYSKTAIVPTEFIDVIMPIRPGQNSELIQISEIPVTIEDEFHDNNEAIGIRISTQNWTDYLILAPDTKGIKRINQFETKKEIQLVRLDKDGNILLQFDGKLNESNN